MMATEELHYLCIKVEVHFLLGVVISDEFWVELRLQALVPENRYDSIYQVVLVTELFCEAI